MRISWQAEEESHQVRLKWEENGGPSVISPSTTGYGTELIRSSIGYGLGGHVEQTYAAGGLQAEIVIPLGRASPAD
jgi:two-component sensor histidine kinase